MKSLIKRIIPRAWLRELRELASERRSRRIAYSQEGEDLVLARFFGDRTQGIYVDVGAHHPFRFSNTYLLYKQGWKGINIDAAPGSMALFNRFRPRDINIEVGVSVERKSLPFFVFKEPALNTFDQEIALSRQRAGWLLTETKQLECVPLSAVLSETLPKLGGSDIDLLSVDVEGLDLEVLKSNDWTRFRPRMLVVEILDQDLGGVLVSEISRFCDSNGYSPFSKLYQTTFFVRREAA